MTSFEYPDPFDTNTFTSRRELGWSLSKPPRRKEFSLFVGQPQKYVLPQDIAKTKRNAFFRKVAATLVSLALGGYMIYGALRPNLETAPTNPRAPVAAPK